MQTINEDQILNIAGEFYVGYNPAHTLETALGTVGRRYNQHLGLSLSMGEMRELMSGYNVVNCGGLNNYFVKLYRRMEELCQTQSLVS